MPEPFYIAADDQQLYAVYYPAVGAPRNENVLFVPGFGQDQVRLYRASHDSAMRLSRDGFNVLRFDYRGTGNSSDPSTSFSLTAWQADLAAAAEEVKEISGCHKTAAICSRIGSLVMTAHPESFGKTAFFDPVISGAEYVETLSGIHAAMCSNPHKYLHPEGKVAETQNELVGHAMPDNLLSELKQSAMNECFTTVDSFAVVSEESALKSVSPYFASAQCVPFDCRWTDVNALEEMINPQPCFRQLENHLCGRGIES